MASILSGSPKKRPIPVFACIEFDGKAMAKWQNVGNAGENAGESALALEPLASRNPSASTA
jgi:hypothetical protein